MDSFWVAYPFEFFRVFLSFIRRLETTRHWLHKLPTLSLILMRVIYVKFKAFPCDIIVIFCPKRYN